MPPSAQKQASPRRSDAPFKDSLGCVSGHLQNDLSLCADGVRIHRKTMDQHELHQVETEASGRGMLLGVSLRDGHRRRVFDGRQATCQAFDKGSVYIRGFADRYRADICRPFDFVLLEISDASIERAGREKEGRRVIGLSHVAGVGDEVLFNLASALAPALAHSSGASTLFIDQVSTAMTTHLVDIYGGSATTAPRTNRVLSLSCEARAKEMLRNKIDGNISITEIADACGLSRSYFIHAFRETIGQTPHRWMIGQRLEHARTLLTNSSMPLADVAAACGFSDQSHFTRAFARHVGAPPGVWRRKKQASDP